MESVKACSAKTGLPVPISSAKLKGGINVFVTGAKLLLNVSASKRVQFRESSVFSKISPFTLQSCGLLTGYSMYYHTIIITLFGYLKTPTNSDEASIAAASSAREECTRSACHVADMFKSHRTHWAINRAPSAYLQWATISLFTLLDDLETPRSRSAFMGLCAALRSLSLRWFLAKGILRLAQLTAKERHVDLPAESAELLRDLDGQSWEARDRQLLGCLYPNCAVAVSDVALALNRAGFEHCSFRWDLLAASPSSSSPDLSDGFGQGSD